MILELQKIMKKTKYYWLNIYNIAKTTGKLSGLGLGLGLGLG